MNVGMYYVVNTFTYPRLFVHYEKWAFPTASTNVWHEIEQPNTLIIGTIYVYHIILMARYHDTD